MTAGYDKGIFSKSWAEYTIISAAKNGFVMIEKFEKFGGVYKNIDKFRNKNNEVIY